MRNQKFKLIINVILIITLCLCISACSSIIPTSTPSPEPTPTASPTPTQAPTPTPVPTLSPEQQENLDLQAKLVLAPDIEGTSKVIKEINGLKRVTYERDKVYVGEYKKEVTFEEKEVGGIVFIASEAERILSENKDAVIVPVDISEINDNTEVKLELLDATTLDGNKHENCLLTIDTNAKKVSIVNITDCEITNQSRIITPGKVYPECFKVSIVPILEKGTTKFFPEINGDFDNSVTMQGIFPLGQKMVETSKTIGLDYSSSSDLKTIENSNLVQKDKNGNEYINFIEANK